MKLGFGTWRFVLALLVAISHLWSGMIHGPAAYAVWGFFVLSGYLMTYVLSNKYGVDQAGLKDFAFNRFLRIFPLYWIACILGAISLFFLPKLGITPSSLNPQFLPPQSDGDWFNNLTLLPIVGGQGLFVPVSGALAVEVAAYILMPIMAFSRQASWLGLILSLTLNLRYGLQIESFGVRYSSFLTCFAAFAVGTLVCHYKNPLEKISAPVISVLVWAAHCLIWIRYDQWPWTYGLYVSVLLSAWVVLSLSKLETSPLDNILGDLSYPLYLFHTTVAVWVLTLPIASRSFGFFLLSFFLTLVLSWVLIIAVDRPVHKLKKKKA
ncbi:peptidoglycan/LPS O-acetylase OafA/YrhL [Actimicrobium sp. GrIS 1.19]|uniref:acyltransferase family protein n=1 Tax=Actimicrobium sp. GrIS 1.19 TaxID=3071708 RepID=UPI002DFE3813|nr:peptidoglycan/LPS O-acetylase OafA/YrhL [Actimicrobium sp. GrIS 1.19]